MNKTFVSFIIPGIVIAVAAAFLVAQFWEKEVAPELPAPEPVVIENPAPEEPVPAYKDLIRVTSPLPEAEITSPLVIEGEARGNWFFEATFPVVLVDWDGRIIAESYATAQGEWMTTEYVPFTATLNFTADTTVSSRGALILQKSNPSGLPENDDALEIPVFFKP